MFPEGLHVSHHTLEYSLSHKVDKVSRNDDKLSRNYDNLPRQKPFCPDIMIKCPENVIKCPEIMIKYPTAILCIIGPLAFQLTVFRLISRLKHHLHHPNEQNHHNHRLKTNGDNSHDDIVLWRHRRNMVVSAYELKAKLDFES